MQASFEFDKQTLKRSNSPIQESSIQILNLFDYEQFVVQLVDSATSNNCCKENAQTTLNKPLKKNTKIKN